MNFHIMKPTQAKGFGVRLIEVAVSAAILGLLAAIVFG